jgi:hypothetical protein
MTQPTQSAHDLKQYAVKEHVKAMLRKIPRKSERRRERRYLASA